ncbi:MAG: type II toxin-antitoxin system RelE/ParE family toxin [Sphingobacteriia bacterium]
MDISFRPAKLEKTVATPRDVKKHYGDNAKSIIARLEDLASAPNLEVMRTLPGKTHELKGDRAGELGIHVSANHRITFRPSHDPLPRKADGSLDWQQVTAIVIDEINEDYHRR